jgi:membrane protein
VARLRRALRLGWRAAGRGVIEFYRSENLTFASSIAYYALLSIFPFLLLVLTVLSRLAIGQEGRGVVTVLNNALPERFEFLSEQVLAFAQAPIQLSLIGTAVTLWASMGVFGAVTSAVNHAWGVEQPLGFWRHKLIAFVMLLASGVLLLTALLLTGAIQVVESNWFSGVVARFPWLLELRGFVYRHSLTPTFIFVVGLIYYFAPNAQVRLRDVWFGAILAGLLWRVAFAGFAWYVAATSDRLTVHGSIGTVVVFLLWVYISAVIFLYGVEVTAAYARLRKHLPQQAPAAPARD